jgi:hypothetical protein
MLLENTSCLILQQAINIASSYNSSTHVIPGIYFSFLFLNYLLILFKATYNIIPLI